MAERVTKRDLELLGRVFSREIAGQLPFQTSSKKHVASLVERGLIQTCQRIFPPRPPFGAVRVEGFALTELGRMTYCMSCEDDDG